MGERPLLEVRDVCASYEGVEALHRVSFGVHRGTVTAILGANGAGKSTLLAVIAGILTPTEGEVRFDGELVTGGSAASLARRGLCLVPEGRGVFPNLTVRENLWVMTHSGVDRRELESQSFERFSVLATRRNQAAGTLSGGEQQMLAMARALATRPKLLLLDELSMGLAPIVVQELYQHVSRLAEEGVTVVVVEQFRANCAVGRHIGDCDGRRPGRAFGSTGGSRIRASFSIFGIEGHHRRATNSRASPSGGAGFQRSAGIGAEEWEATTRRVGGADFGASWIDPDGNRSCHPTGLSDSISGIREARSGPGPDPATPGNPTSSGINSHAQVRSRRSRYWSWR